MLRLQVSCDAVLFLLTFANPLGLTSDWPAWPPVLFLFLRVCVEMLDVKEAAWGGGVHIFTVYILCSYCSALTFSPLQQVQTCVWDVSSPFRIVLVNGSKVNAEETAKVNTCSFCKTSIQVPVNMSRKTCTRGFTLAFLSGWITQRSLKATVKYYFW